jgi:hypothetical protein
MSFLLAWSTKTANNVYLVQGTENRRLVARIAHVYTGPMLKQHFCKIGIPEQEKKKKKIEIRKPSQLPPTLTNQKIIVFPCHSLFILSFLFLFSFSFYFFSLAPNPQMAARCKGELPRLFCASMRRAWGACHMISLAHRSCPCSVQMCNGVFPSRSVASMLASFCSSSSPHPT